MNLPNTSQPAPSQGSPNGTTSIQPQMPKPMFPVKGTEATSPLDYVTRNLAAKAEAVPAPAEPRIEVPPVITEPAHPAETPPAEGEGDFSPQVPEPPTKEAEQAVAADEVDEEGSETPAETNFKKLRTNLKTLKEEAKTTKEQLAAAEAELEKYKTGEKLPDALQEKEAEIASLRQYQKIVDLKVSPEYQEKYAKPLTEAGNKLEQIFAEYKLNKEDLSKARSLTSAKERNEFLSEHFDPTGAIEVKGLLEKEHGLAQSAKELEKEPAKALESLIRDSQQVVAVKRRQEREAMNHVLRDTWAESLSKIKEEGVFKELIYKEGDKKYNDTIVKPILESASAEAGKFVRMLFDGGLRELKPEVAKFISRMCLLGHSSAINATTRQRALEHLQELEKNTTRTNAIIRPHIGASGNAPQGQPAREPMTPATMAKQLTAKIIG
jgi:hypothetical protein